MINIRQFEIALKLTWLRTFISDTPDWSEFAYRCKIDRLLQAEIHYHNTILKNTKNLFWKRVIIGYTKFFLSIKNETIQKTELTPIWGNPDIQVKFNVSLFKANVR